MRSHIVTAIIVLTGATTLAPTPSHAAEEPVRLSLGTTDTSSEAFAISHDSQIVVYTSDQDSDGFDELFSVPIDGTAPPTQLNDDSSALNNVASFEIDATSTRVVYRADHADDAVDYELFSVPIDGSSAAVRLNDALPIAASVRS